MDQYVGLDVSLKETHFCVVDGAGAELARGRELTHPTTGCCGRIGMRPGAAALGRHPLLQRGARRIR